MAKKLIKEGYDELDLGYAIEGSPEEIYENLKFIVKQKIEKDPTAHNFRFGIGQSYDYCELTLRWDREETDAEQKRRLEKRKKNIEYKKKEKAKKEERERKELERLKKKYE